MRSKDVQRTSMFTTVSTEDLVPDDHPLRQIRVIVNEALRSLSPRFESIYSAFGRPSIPPEKLLRAMLLQVFYTIRSERQLIEQLRYNMLFRWFVGLSIDERIWDATTFTKNRERFLDGDIAKAFFDAVLDQARAENHLSGEHFTVDGTLIEAWASHKSFRPIDDDQNPPTGGGSNADVDFSGTKRSNATHRSTTDPDARLCRKSSSTTSQLAYCGNVLMENRCGLAVESIVVIASGTAEREAALIMTDAAGLNSGTIGADKGYDVESFTSELRKRGVTPHVAQNNKYRRSSIDGRTTRHPGYGQSQRKRKRVEEQFGWAKVIGGVRKVKVRGLARVDAVFRLAIAGFNVLRLANLRLANA